MKSIVNKQHSGPSNSPTDGDAFIKMLEAMTEEELTDGLNEALESMTEESYDSALIDAYLAALDQKAPMPETPDAGTSFVNFKNRVLMTIPIQNDRTSSSRHRARFIWRIGLIAALTIICLMGSMVVAQAFGMDVFGTIARWTNEVFSLGTIHSDGADDGIDMSTLNDSRIDSKGETVYTSLQEALNDYAITEVYEPTWIPEGYAFESVEADIWPDDNSLIGLFAKYYNGDDFLQIKIERYQGNANEQVEKSNVPIETFTIDGFPVYLLENVNSNSAAWATEHYECYISGKVEKQALKQMVLSAYAPTTRR